MIKPRTRIIGLRDGRNVEFAEYGDSHGLPVFYFHGYMGSCHQAAISDAVARDEGVRIIAPNRPGIGRSTPYRFAVMTDYADDITQLADALHIGSFAIVGASAGGCFALSCAHMLPHRVRVTGVAGTLGPLNVVFNLQKMHWLRRFFLYGCHRHPRVAYGLLSVVFCVCKHYPRRTFEWMTSASTVIPKNPSMREDLLKALWWDHQDVFLQHNGIEALLNETHLFFHWGFDLRNFTARRQVIFWHGMSDTIVPLRVIRRVALQLKRCQTIACAGGHLALVGKMREVLVKIKGAWDGPVPSPPYHVIPRPSVFPVRALSFS